MTFGLYLPSSLNIFRPPSSPPQPRLSSNSTTTTTQTKSLPSPHAPIIFFLSGLTCNDTNFALKAGNCAFAATEHENIAIVLPDTSPARLPVAPDDTEDAYDLGYGAGFYVDATESPYDVHYRMKTYVEEELWRC